MNSYSSLRSLLMLVCDKMNGAFKVAAVVVVYNPEQFTLCELLRKLKRQCALVIIVCNSRLEYSSMLSAEIASDQCSVITNDGNLGIGSAQNIGIRFALERGASHVAVFDQDSLPDESMIERLVWAEADLKRLGVNVAAVGPRLVDEKTGAPGAFIGFAGLRKVRLRPPAGSPPVPCFSLLASGTLFRREALEAVGFMNPDLFLEYVDVEWGARARSKGYICYGVPSATLFHNLGDSRFRLPGGLTVPFHRPVRHYYTMRNAVFMQKQQYVPAYWKLHDIVRSVAGFLIYTACNPPRMKQFVMMSVGVVHGLAGISGPFSVDKAGQNKVVRRLIAWAAS